MTEPRSNTEAVHAPDRVAELRREAATMALYVAVCLLATLSAIADRSDAGHADVFAVIWGTTVGLALAHWFAFRLSARLVAAGRLRGSEAEIAGAQLAGAAATALLATAPVVVVPDAAELDVVRLLLAGFVTAIGFVVARSGGAGRGRATVYAGAILVITVTIAVLKNVLSGH